MEEDKRNEKDPSFYKFAWKEGQVPKFIQPQCAFCANNYYDPEIKQVLCEIHFFRPGIYTTNSEVCPFLTPTQK